MAPADDRERLPDPARSLAVAELRRERVRRQYKDPSYDPGQQVLDPVHVGDDGDRLRPGADRPRDHERQGSVRSGVRREGGDVRRHRGHAEPRALGDGRGAERRRPRTTGRRRPTSSRSSGTTASCASTSGRTTSTRCRSGNVALSMAWAPDILQLQIGGFPNLKFVVPGRGRRCSGRTASASRSWREHPLDALTFMDYIYRPEIAAHDRRDGSRTCRPCRIRRTSCASEGKPRRREPARVPRRPRCTPAARLSRRSTQRRSSRRGTSCSSRSSRADPLMAIPVDGAGRDRRVPLDPRRPPVGGGMRRGGARAERSARRST